MEGMTSWEQFWTIATIVGLIGWIGWGCIEGTRQTEREAAARIYSQRR